MNIYQYFAIDTIYKLLGGPDPRDIANRLLRAQTQDPSAASDKMRRASQWQMQQADDIGRKRDGVDRFWHGEAADQAKNKLSSIEDSVRQQARQLADGAEHLAQVSDALRKAQANAQELVKEIDAAEDGLKTTSESVLSALGGSTINTVIAALDLAQFGTYLSQMLDIQEQYESTLRSIAPALRVPKGIMRPDAGPKDSGNDARARQAALYRNIHGSDPRTDLDWKMAQALDPRSSDPAATDAQANVVVTRIRPVPGAGVVHGDAFISDPTVLGPPKGLPPAVNYQGDNRGFHPNAPPGKSRESFYIDYERGIVVARQNPSHSEDGTQAAAGDPEIGIEQDKHGRVRLRNEGIDGLAPRDLGKSVGGTVRNDLIIDPHGGGDSTASVNGRIGQYPSWEFSHSTPDGETHTLLQRPENNYSVAPDNEPFEQLPRDTVEVGQEPEQLKQWNNQYHPNQTPAAIEQDIEERVGGTPIGDPWYNNPLPRQPYPQVHPGEGLVIPEAKQVR